MAFDMGFDFRSTSGYVADPAYGVFASTEAYPHTYTNGNGQSINAGWTAINAASVGQNLSTTDDVRLAGDVYAFDGDVDTFQVDLSSGSAPGAGTYTIDMALGTGVAGARRFTAIFVKDNTTAVIGPSGDTGSIAADHFIDATLATVAATTNWTGATVSKAFATTTVILGFTAHLDFASVAHFRLTLASTPVTSSVVLDSNPLDHYWVHL